MPWLISQSAWLLVGTGDNLRDDDDKRGTGGNGDAERQHGEDGQIGGESLWSATMLLRGFRGHGRGQRCLWHGGYTGAVGCLGRW